MASFLKGSVTSYNMNYFYDVTEHIISYLTPVEPIPPLSGLFNLSTVLKNTSG